MFVRFHSGPLLLHLRSSLGEDEDREFDPHLSLLYKKISEEEQAQLAAEIQLPFSSVSFDTIAATRCRLPIATAADVVLWESLGSRRLVD